MLFTIRADIPSHLIQPMNWRSHRRRPSLLCGLEKKAGMLYMLVTPTRYTQWLCVLIFTNWFSRRKWRDEVRKKRFWRCLPIYVLYILLQKYRTKASKAYFKLPT